MSNEILIGISILVILVVGWFWIMKKGTSVEAEVKKEEPIVPPPAPVEEVPAKPTKRARKKTTAKGN